MSYRSYLLTKSFAKIFIMKGKCVFNMSYIFMLYFSLKTLLIRISIYVYKNLKNLENFVNLSDSKIEIRMKILLHFLSQVSEYQKIK